MKPKLHLGVLFGGKSTEHEISILSTRSVLDAIDKEKYDISLVGINQQGQWQLINDHQLKASIENGNSLAFIPGQGVNGSSLIELTKQKHLRKMDVIFPILHGIYGEDGSVQGLLKLANIPFVGADLLGSAIGMDKDVMKRLLRDAGIKIPHFLVFHKWDKQKINFQTIKAELGLPLFIKPANTGSSIGVSKVKSEDEFHLAIDKAFSYDQKIILEEYIAGREIECAVLGNENPAASILGEIIPHHEFYSYEAKYLDENGATLQIPAQIRQDISENIQALAIKTFCTLSCSGMARIDFFLRNEEVFVNEINTIPGFTSISMYPRLWQASGISYSDLIDKLIELAIDKFEQSKHLCTQYLP